MVSGWGQQRDGAGRLLAQPAWVARFDQPCRRQVLSARSAAAVVGGVVLYPQPAAPGARVRLVLAPPVAGPVQVQLLDALGRAVAVAGAASEGGELAFTLPAGLAPGLYAVRVQAGRPAVATARLLVQGP